MKSFPAEKAKGSEIMRCPECRGRGHNSRHLGSFTAEEFDEFFSTDEERESYLRGDYDHECGCCHGTGEIDRERERDRAEELVDQRLADAENGVGSWM